MSLNDVENSRLVDCERFGYSNVIIISLYHRHSLNVFKNKKVIFRKIFESRAEAISYFVEHFLDADSMETLYWNKYDFPANLNIKYGVIANIKKNAVRI